MPNAHLKHDDHDHSGGFHTHAPAGKIKTAFFLTLLIFIVEVIGGLISHSLALLSDAGHVLTDIAAIGLSWFALKQAERPANQKMTYGYYRSGILAALINGVTLILITLWILWEAYRRLHHPEPVQSTWMFISAGVGLTINLILGLRMSKEEDINIKSAVLHMLGDAAASAGVIIGGIIILVTKWYVVDPVLSVLIAVLIAWGAWRIVKQTVLILMEATPVGIDFRQTINVIKQVPGILDVHDVHIWSITSGKNALSCHVVVDRNLTIGAWQEIMRQLEQHLKNLGIGHVTIQPEDCSHMHDNSELCTVIKEH